MVTSQSSVETNSTRKFDDKRRGVFGPLSDVADFPGAPVGTDNNSSTFSVSNIRSGASDFRGAVPRDNFGGSYLPSSAGYFEGPPGGFVAGVRTGFANVSAGATPYNFLGDDNASRIEHRNGAVLLVSGVSYLGVALVGKSFSGYDITAKTDFPSTYVLGVF